MIRSKALSTCAVLGALAALSWTDLWAADVWWQLATGRWIVENGAPPRVDPFSWTTAGREWVEPRWGFEALLYLLYQSAGPCGLVAAKTLLLAAAFALAAGAAPCRRAPGLHQAGVALAVVAASERFRVRPEVVTFLLFGATLWLLERARRSRRARGLLVLPVLCALWANLHSLPFLGPALAFAYALGAGGDRLRLGRRGPRPFPFLAAALAGSLALLANPYGAEAAFELPWKLFREIRAGHVYAGWITEFLPPWDPRAAGNYLYAFWPLLAAVGVAVAANLRRTPSAHLLLAGAFGYLSLTACRNVPLFAIAALPVLATALERLGRRRVVRGASGPATWIAFAASLAVLFLAVTDRWYVAEGSTRRTGCGVSEYQFPILATEFVLAERPPGRGFASLGDASYLIWRGIPVYADGRLELHDVSTFETFLAVGRGEIDPDGAPDLAEVRWCVVDHAALQPLVTRLARPGSPWRLVHLDGLRAVYVREGPDTRAWLDGLAARRLALPVEDLAAARAERPPTFLAARAGVLSARLGWFYYRTDRPDRAIEFFERADSIRPLDPWSRLRLAECLMDQGGLDRAEDHLERVVRDAPGMPDPHRWLGLLAWGRRRDREAALGHYREYFRLGGTLEAARRELRAIESAPGD